MSSPGLTSESQLRYILQWFREFSELQREDFLPILGAARGHQPDQLAEALASLSCQDKPISLFQCRIKLFNEWFPTWSEEEQDRLVKEVIEIDGDFGKKLKEILPHITYLNGEHNVAEAIIPNVEKEVKANGIHSPEYGSEEEDKEPHLTQDNVHVEIAAAS